MSADDAQTGRDAAPELQFDRVETTGSPSQSVAPGVTAVTCAVCGKSVGDEYFTANGKPICANCRQVVTTAAATPRSVGPLLLAALFGFGASVAGAAIYYAVIAITNLEIGIVAIVIGYMVGWAVRKGAGGRGGRRFQILALALTYWAVGLAYAPLAYKEVVKNKVSSSAQFDSTATNQSTIGERLGDSAQAAAPGGTSGVKDEVRSRDALVALGGLFLLIFALPVMSVVGSMPFGLLSALIIFIGLRQAWHMTGAHQLEISGPYKVGTGPASTSSSST
jgi:hypothetical protein